MRGHLQTLPGIVVFLMFLVYNVERDTHEQGHFTHHHHKRL